MPNPTTPKVFKKSLLAVAVLSLSGCASAPKMNDVDLSPIGEGILVAGRATAEVGIHAWDVGMYLLGFSDDVGQTNPNAARTPFPIDEVDLALLEEDALPEGDALIPLEIANATANKDEENLESLRNQLSLFASGPSLTSSSMFIEPELKNEAVVEEFDASRLDLETDDAELLAETEESAAPMFSEPQDYIHVVSSNENLWDIAKATTGDATNWHQLADVNDLNQNAAVFAGQELVIPAQMVKPELQSTLSQAVLGDQLAANAAVDDAASDANSELLLAESDINTKRLEIPPVAQTTGTAIKLNAGETLWDFSKRTTGDATNWQTIANHNGFTAEQAVVVRAGQSILVPEDIVKPEATLAKAEPTVDVDEAATTAARAKVLAAIEKANQSSLNGGVEASVEASSELLTEASTLSNTQSFTDETQAITIVEANYQADLSQQRLQIEREPVAIVKMDAPEADLDKIMISGTYYPKAIYNNADFSSSLLMRVSPGTSLKVSKAVGNWFEVETERGTGYVHQRDIK